MRVNSTVIDRVRYNPLTRNLKVDMHDSGRYVYHDVSPATRRLLVHSRSVGADFNRHVRDRYAFDKR